MREEYKFKTAPYAHQLRDFLRSRDLEAFAVLWEMGTGKSKLAIDTAAWLYDNGKIDSVLVLAYKGCYMNWIDQHLPEHLPAHVKAYAAWWDAGGGIKHERTYERLLRPSLELKILVMNVESLAYKKGAEFAARFAAPRRCLCVLDESTSIKNPKALRTKTALKLSRLFKYRRIMTGSPVTNGPLNLYSQAEFLAPYLLGHSSYYSYRAEFCTMVDMRVNNVTFKKVVGYKNIDRLVAKMAPWSSVVKKKDCLDLPPKVYETCDVDMTPEQGKVYKDLKEKSIAELSEGYVAPAIVLTKILRLQQVLCGFVPNEDGTIVEISENRTVRLMEVVGEASGKVIIWSRFVRSIERVAAELRKEYGPESTVTYYGATSQEARGENIRRFQEDDETRFFVGNQQTGGYGITLTAASTVVYYANSFDLEAREQSEDRCHRIGQKNSVTYVDLRTPRTVDDKIIKALREKKKISDLVLDPLGRKRVFEW